MILSPKKCFILAVICITTSSHALQPPPKKLVLGCMPFGLFVNFGLVISNLAWCARTKTTPLVYWHHKCLYSSIESYNGSTNPWEYYFEQVSSEPYTGEAVHDRYAAPDNSFISLTYEAQNQPSHAERKKIYETAIKPYIKLNPIVQEKVNNFFESHMRGKHTIGIHLRGTDKIREVKPVAPERILQEAQRQADAHDGISQFFVATDEERLLELAIQILRADVIAYDSHRSLDGNPLHHDGIYPAHLVGEEVVIEAWLLSLCDLMVHTDRSNVSGAVLFLNPHLKNILMMPE